MIGVAATLRGIGVAAVLRVIGVAAVFRLVGVSAVLRVIAIAAVLPTEQGKGHCSKLFKALHRIADAEGVPCFLDCGSEKNVAVYTRLGYKVVASETRSAGPSDDVTIYVMVREVPGGASSAI